MMAIAAGLVDELAERLATAERDRRPIPPLTSDHPTLSARDAYAVQQAIVRRRLETGERIVGWKVGLTSRAMQEQLGVEQPDYAPILSGWYLPDGATIPMAELIQPRAEAEIAFELARPLRGPGVSAADVLAATAGLRPAIEVIDSRIEAWRITLADTIADLASSARVVVGGRLTAVEALDLPALGVVFEKNGEAAAHGVGSAVLGDPAAAVAWAANALGALDVTLEAGHIVMPGAMHASIPVAAGDVIRADFDEIGSVGLSFA